MPPAGPRVGGNSIPAGSPACADHRATFRQLCGVDESLCFNKPSRTAWNRNYPQHDGTCQPRRPL